MAERAVALTIAGSDSSGAAGIQADLKTFHQLGVYGTSAITLVSAQHAARVELAQCLEAELVAAQITSACTDFSVAAVKIGALGSAENARAVARALRSLPHGPLVLDPVTQSSSGSPLLGAGGLEAVREELLPCADLFTPNLPEVALFLGAAVETPAERVAAAKALRRLGAKAVLVKGGHSEGEECADYLWNGHRGTWLRAKRHDTPHTRGTGCTYAAAIAAFLARGFPLFEAVERAHGFLQRAIQGAPGARLKNGSGRSQRGPLDHWAEEQ